MKTKLQTNCKHCTSWKTCRPQNFFKTNFLCTVEVTAGSADIFTTHLTSNIENSQVGRQVKLQFFMPTVYLCSSLPSTQLAPDDVLLLVVLLLYESFLWTVEVTAGSVDVRVPLD